MKRSQWFVFGIGLILLSFYLGFVSGMNDCLELQDMYTNIQDKSLEAGLNPSDYSGDAWIISCLDSNLNWAGVSTIVFTLGILFIICGFLEPKQKH